MDDKELADVATEWLTTARAAWPQLALDATAFITQVVAKLPVDIDREGARALHIADLWLAAACAAGDARALAAFDEHYLAPLVGTLAATGLTPDEIDEVKQELRRKLFVADDRPARIADYSGRADLRIWLRTAAIRAAIDLLRRQRETPVENEELDDLPAIIDDPELAHLKQRYRDELRGAVAAAMDKLSPRERLLLKYHYVDGHGIDRLADIYGVHRATAARWLGAAREALADHTHRLLITQFGVTPSELRSIARIVESQLDLSIRRLLAG